MFIDLKRQKFLSMAVVFLGVTVLGISIFVFQRPLREKYYLGKLNSQDKTVKAHAAKKLGELGSIDAIPLLESSLADADRDVRYEAAVALRRIEPSKVLFPPFCPSISASRRGKVSMIPGSVRLADVMRYITEETGLQFNSKSMSKEIIGRDVEVPASMSNVDY